MEKLSKKIKKLFFLAIIAPHALNAPPLPYQALAAFAGAPKQGTKPKISSLAAGKAYLDIMKNIYKFGPNSSPTTALIRDPRAGLFNIHTNAFRTSQNPANPTYILGGQLAGRVIGGLSTQEIFTKAGAQGLSEFWRKQFKEQFPKDKLSQQRVNEFIDLLKRSYEETQSPSSLFIPELTQIALFSHQVLREQPITELVEMYKELSDAGIVDFTTIDPERLYTNAQFEEFKNQIDQLEPSKQAQELISKPELTIGTAFYLKNVLAPLPPAPKTAEMCYKESNDIPNCVETGLHDLVNILTFDSETRTFNPQKMLPETLTINPKLIEFYQKHSQSDESTITDARQDWFNLMTEIPGIKYNRHQHELFQFFENQVKVLNFLFGTSAQKLEDFNNLLSNPEKKVVFKPLKTYTNHNQTNGIYSLSIGIYSGLELHAEKNHGYLKRPYQEEQLNIINQNTAKEIVQKDIPSTLLPLLIPYLTEKNKPAEYLQKIYAKDLDDPNQLLDVINNTLGKLLNNHGHQNLNSQQKNSLALQTFELIEKLPLQDTHFQEAVSKTAIKVGITMIAYDNPAQEKFMNFLTGKFKGKMLSRTIYDHTSDLINTDNPKYFVEFMYKLSQRFSSDTDTAIYFALKGLNAAIEKNTSLQREFIAYIQQFDPKFILEKIVGEIGSSRGSEYPYLKELSYDLIQKLDTPTKNDQLFKLWSTVTALKMENHESQLEDKLFNILQEFDQNDVARFFTYKMSHSSAVLKKFFRYFTSSKTNLNFENAYSISVRITYLPPKILDDKDFLKVFFQFYDKKIRPALLFNKDSKDNQAGAAMDNKIEEMRPEDKINSVKEEKSNFMTELSNKFKSFYQSISAI